MAETSELPKEFGAESPFELSGLTKLVAGLAALAYGTGVVAINTYLHGLGIADFSFAKPKLLLTGTLILTSFLALASSPIFIAWRLASPSDTDDTAHRQSKLSVGILLLGVLSLLTLVVACNLLCFRLDSPLGQIQEWWIWELLKPETSGAKFGAATLIVVGIYLPICTSAFCAYEVRRLLILRTCCKIKSYISLECFYLAITIAFFVISVIGYIFVFTFSFYPSVPMEFGGGEPYFESLAISDDERCQLQQIGVPFRTKTPSITKPLPILHETDTLIAVWLQGNDPGSKPSEGEQHGLGKQKFIVVQLDKSSIIATKAFPHGENVPLLVLSPAACGAHLDEFDEKKLRSKE